MNRLLNIFSQLTAALILFCIVCLGCSTDNGPPTGNLTGVVQNGNEVVGDCKVALFSSLTKRTKGAKVGPDGKYEIAEIPTGDYSVFVLQKPSETDKELPFDKRIPQKFRDPKTSGLSVSIKEGDNNFEIDLSQ